MAVFLATFSVAGKPVPADFLQAMQQVLSRAGTVGSWSQGGSALVHVELGLWPGRSLQEAGDTVTLVAGDPVICAAPDALPREAAIRQLAARLAAVDGPNVLQEADGTFAGLYLDASAPRLCAFTDKLGVRPLYWAQVGELVFVASSYWALQGLLGRSLSPDWRAAAETAAVGFPLGDRTLAAQISLLGPGHWLKADAEGVRSEPYWNWQGAGYGELRGGDLIEHVQSAFDRAVRRRLRGSGRALAYLSGGMDSRLIVASLRAGGAQVRTLNFAPAGSQDLVLGRMAAESMGCLHYEYGEGGVDFAVRRSAALQAWVNACPEIEGGPHTRPRLVWSGDGGSVSLGHVYLTPQTVAAARLGGTEAAATEIARSYQLSPNIFRRDWRALAKMPMQSILEDLRSRPEAEPGRNCHLFYMLNDQRRHLAQHFETIHEHRTDHILPFFDGSYLATVLHSRVDDFLQHRLYNRLIQRLPGGTGQVPWQAYPGHEPCPWPVPPGLRQQWEDGWHNAATLRKQAKAMAKKLRSDLRSHAQAAEVLDRPLLQAVALATECGFTRYRYLLQASVPFLSAAQAGGLQAPDLAQ
jgi:asparagine synthase (glutamine-hydrolysing)